MLPSTPTQTSSLTRKQTARKELAKRQLARNHLIDFTEYTFPNYEARPHHKLIASALEAVFWGRISRLMIFVPPQYGKSELSSRRLPAWWLGHKPDTRIMVTSYAASLAQTFSRDARQIVASSEYTNVFGTNAHPTAIEYAIELDDKQKSVSHWGLEGKRGSLKASGVGGGISGHGADLAIIDDPVKDDMEAQSERFQRRLVDWYDGALYSRLSRDGAIVLIMTRWHQNDLAGHLLQKQAEGGDEWHVLRMPARAETLIERHEWARGNHIIPELYITQENV